MPFWVVCLHIGAATNLHMGAMNVGIQSVTWSSVCSKGTLKQQIDLF